MLCFCEVQGSGLVNPCCKLQLEVLAAERAEGQKREQLLQSRIQVLNDSLKQAYDRASRGRVHHERCSMRFPSRHRL